MLKIIKLNSNKTNKNIKNDYLNKLPKDYPPSTREWKNSIYVFNKKTLSLIPEASKLAMRFIRSFFNLHNFKLERKIRREKLLKRFRRLSSNRIYVSDGEFKHTNNKVLITLYIYNKQNFNYITKIRNKYTFKLKKRRMKFILRFRLKRIKRNLRRKMNIYKIYIYRKYKLLNNEHLSKLNLIKFNKKRYIFIKNLNLNSLEMKEKHLLTNILKYKYYINKFFSRYKIRSLRRLKRYFRHKRLLHINRSKFKYSYLKHLMNIVKKIYNKNVEFNIINLKYFYSNSDIFSQTIIFKVRRNRRRLLRIMNRAKRKIKTRRWYWVEKHSNQSPKLSYKLYEDPMNEILFNNFYNYLKKKNSLKETILNLIKYKKVTGIRLEAKGRLTRRYTASRSKHKVRYEGNLRNTDSYYHKRPSVILRGNTRSNLQFTKLKSKTRIGSFGIKGWVSGT